MAEAQENMRRQSRLLAAGILTGIAVIILVGLAFKERQQRKQEALKRYRQVQELIRNERWDQAFAMTDRSYQAFANIVNFRSDFEFITSSPPEYLPNVSVVGLWSRMDVYLESLHQSGSGVFVEFHRRGDVWMIHGKGTWSNDD